MEDPANTPASRVERRGVLAKATAIVVGAVACAVPIAVAGVAALSPWRRKGLSSCGRRVSSRWGYRAGRSAPFLLDFYVCEICGGLQVLNISDQLSHNGDGRRRSWTIGRTGRSATVKETQSLSRLPIRDVTDFDFFLWVCRIQFDPYVKIDLVTPSASVTG